MSVTGKEHTMADEKRQQMSEQCRAIAKLAQNIAEVHAQLARTWAPDSGVPLTESLVESVGRHTAERMEILGDMLNGMDAATDEDDWMSPIFEKAHELWPTQ